MRVLYLEPFAAGSHAAFGAALTRASWASWTRLTLPGRHWKWRMRGSAAYFARDHAAALAEDHDLLFASAYLPLAELVGLCPKLGARPRVLYFHENQLSFPARAAPRERDNHFGFTQLVSALAASCCLFNSAHNRDSFLAAGAELLARMPDAVPGDWIATIAARSRVLGLPLELPEFDDALLADLPADARGEGPLIVWNHRWEHDKGPEGLVRIVDALLERGLRFRLAVCGQQFRRRPAVLVEAESRWRARLGPGLVQFGELASRRAYEGLLAQAQLVLSTARHEFFGISVLEAVHWGARPLVPDGLSYCELVPAEFRYADEAGAVATLAQLCREWTAGRCSLRGDRRGITGRHVSAEVLPRYRELFEELLSR